MSKDILQNGASKNHPDTIEFLRQNAREIREMGREMERLGNESANPDTVAKIEAFIDPLARLSGLATELETHPHDAPPAQLVSDAIAAKPAFLAAYDNIWATLKTYTQAREELHLEESGHVRVPLLRIVENDAFEADLNRKGNHAGPTASVGKEELPTVTTLRPTHRAGKND